MTQLPPSPRALVVALPMIPFQERPTLGQGNVLGKTK